MGKYLTLLLFLLLASCSGVLVNNKSYYNQNSSYYLSYPNLDRVFSVCGSLFTPKYKIKYEADLACSTVKKKAEYVSFSILQSCYLVKPLTYNYRCV